MDFRRRFEVGLAWRTIVFVLCVWIFSQALATPGLRAARIVAGLIAFAALTSLWGFIRRTNFLVSRFIESVRFEDYSQRFSDPSGGGFDVLGDALDSALKGLQARHGQQAAESRYLSAIVDDAPSALIAIDEGGRVDLLNKSARQLFGRHAIHQVSDLAKLGPEFAAASALPPGSRKITRIVLDGVPQKAVLASAQVARLDRPVKVLSILPIQNQLGAVEVAAQADLVRVLTHEIMNSLTPVTSLARSSAEMVAAAEESGANLTDARLAAETVARRAEGILHFVESYREFAHSPDVHRRSFLAQPWAEEILKLTMANVPGPRFEPALEVRPKSLTISADPELLAQAVLNLLRNSIRATAEVEAPEVRLIVAREPNGGCSIEVRDNGPGIPADRREDVFLPFYTTHKGGSGVGLSFARQVALAHGGSIGVADSPDGGASIRIFV